MRRVILTVSLSALGAAVRAAEAPNSRPAVRSRTPAAQKAEEKVSPLAWLRGLKEGLEVKASAVRGQAKEGRLASVAAIKGDPKAEDVFKLHWKDGISERALAAAGKERKELHAAVVLALEGKTDEARNAFDAFEAAHPKSPLLKDVQEARQQVLALGGEGAGVAP